MAPPQVTVAVFLWQLLEQVVPVPLPVLVTMLLLTVALAATTFVPSAACGYAFFVPSSALPPLQRSFLWSGWQFWQPALDAALIRPYAPGVVQFESKW